MLMYVIETATLRNYLTLFLMHVQDKRETYETLIFTMSN